MAKKDTYKNLVGQRFGRLVVTKFGGRKNGDIFWICKCDCGNICEPMSHNLTKSKGSTKSCGCAWRKRGKDNVNWTGYEEISGSYWNAIYHNAKNRNIEFTITIEYIWKLFLQQNRKCAITKLPLDVIHCGDRRYQHKCTASLDRIDSKKGYIEGNVQWVHKKINQIKLDMNQKEFIYLCHLVVQNNPLSAEIVENIQNIDWSCLRISKKKKKKL